ncbi:YjfB family protein [Desulfitobacterium sp. THU1]|uniref:YjfB family protein n=1 Tax=Desulfitobacterium sp. THU1 TaxID=3138072 RepID=UPI00311D321C
MDIAAMSVVMNQAKIQQQASISVMKMTMDMASEQSNSLATLIEGMSAANELSVNPHLGSNIDILA